MLLFFLLYIKIALCITNIPAWQDMNTVTHGVPMDYSTRLPSCFQ